MPAPPRFNTSDSVKPLPRTTSTRSIYDCTETISLRSESSVRRELAKSYPPLVMIIGAGIAGLCLAQGLKRAGIPFTVFERDPSPDFSSQGYRVHIDTAGYDVLKSTLPQDKFELFLQSAGEIFPGFVCRDAQTTEWVHAHGKTLGETSRVFSVDRAMLRSLLLSGLEECKEILFGLDFRRYHVLPNGRVEVHFDNGRFIQGSVLVGADGPTSKVRRQCLPRQLRVLDTTCGAIYGKTLVTPELRELGLVTNEVTMIVNQYPQMALCVEPESVVKLEIERFQSPLFPGESGELVDLHKYISWTLLAPTELFHDNGGLGIQDLNTMSPQEVASVAVHVTSDWHPVMRALVDCQASEWCSFMRISTTSPEIKPWTPRAVTLMGDAVHTMAPAGLACSAALQDAAALTKQFVERGLTVEAIGEFEQAMRERGRKGINASLEIARNSYGLPAVETMGEVEF